MHSVVVKGFPRAKWQKDKIQFQWQADLEQVCLVGTNHQAASLMYRLGIGVHTKELTVLDQPDAAVLKIAADKNRQWLNRLDMMTALPKEQMHQDLPWMKEEGYLFNYEQLPQEFLWKFMLWAAKYYKPGQPAEQTILEQFSRFPNYFGVINRAGSDKLAQRFSSRVNLGGWRLPLPSFVGRIAVFQGNRHTPANRLMAVLDEQWQVWELGKANQQTPGLPVALYASGKEQGQLIDKITAYFNTRKFLKTKYLVADQLGSVDVPYGVKTRDNDLRGSLLLGPFTHHLQWLVPEMPQLKTAPGHLTTQSWSRFIDYSNETTIIKRFQDKGLCDAEEPAQMLDAIGQHSVQHAKHIKPMWVSRSASECLVKLPARTSLTHIEAAVCQSMPSGLLRPDLPHQTSRLYDKMEPCLLYTPLNPFARGTLNNK